MADNDVTFSRIPSETAERWALVRAVCECNEKALQKTLPYLNKRDSSPQNQERNKVYCDNAVLYNVSGRTRDGLVGLAFSREPKTEGLPEKLKYLLKDADGAGVNLFQQSQATLASVLEIGRHGLYVDWSEASKHPVIKVYKGEDIINWRWTLIDGAAKLTMLVLHEYAEIDDDYAVQCVDQWRELRLDGGKCICTVWRRPDPRKPPEIVEGPILVRSPGSEFDSIPFTFVGAENNDANIDDAPLYALSYLNRHHFRNSADYEDSVFFVGQAQPWMSGLTEEWRDWMQDKGIYVGSRAPVLLPAGGVYDFAQAAPNMLAMEAMKHKEEQMRSLGARLVEETKAHTATQSDNDKETSTSVLSTCVGNVSSAYQSAIDLCARYMDLEPSENAFQINKDFVRLLADAQTVASMVAAWQAGVIAKNDVRSFMRERSFVPPDRTDEDIDLDLEAEPKPEIDPLTGQPTAAAQGPADSAGAAHPAAPAAAAPDFGPLIDGMKSLVEALGKEPTADQPVWAPIDFGPMVEALKAMHAPEPQAQLDLTGVVEAMRAQAEAIKSMPPPVVNFQAGDVHIAPSAPPQVTFAEGAIKVDAPVTVEAPITVQPAQVVQPKNSQVSFQEDADGNITGATLN